MGNLVEIAGPVFPDECGHGPGCYVGSFLTHGIHQFDLYVFSYDLDRKVEVMVGDEEQAVCIRYGRRGDEYYTPGPIRYLAQAVATPSPGDPSVLDDQFSTYDMAFKLLIKKGMFYWAPKPKGTSAKVGRVAHTSGCFVIREIVGNDDDAKVVP